MLWCEGSGVCVYKCGGCRYVSAVVVWRGGAAARCCVVVLGCVSIGCSQSAASLVSGGIAARFVVVLRCMGAGYGHSGVCCVVSVRCEGPCCGVQRCCLGGRGPNVVVGILGGFQFWLMGGVYGRMGCCWGVVIEVTSRSAGGSWRYMWSCWVSVVSCSGCMCRWVWVPMSLWV